MEKRLCLCDVFEQVVWFELEITVVTPLVRIANFDRKLREFVTGLCLRFLDIQASFPIDIENALRRFSTKDAIRCLASGLKCLATYSFPTISPRLLFTRSTPRFQRGFIWVMPETARW